MIGREDYKETIDALKKIEDDLVQTIEDFHAEEISFGTDVASDLWQEASKHIYEARLKIRAIRGLCVLADQDKAKNGRPTFLG